MPKDDDGIKDGLMNSEAENDGNEEENDIDKIFEELLNEVRETDKSSKKDGEASKEGEGEGVDLEDKFVTPDLMILPPKWFYEKVKILNLPSGMRLTENMIKILDKFYYEGATKGQLVLEHGIPKASIGVAIKRLKDLWEMYKAGTLDLAKFEAIMSPEMNPPPGGPGKQGIGKDKDYHSKSFASYTLKTSTFKEIDRAIAEFLRPQIERSTQFMDVMARIGMLTTYALMQVGIVDKTRFVKLAEVVTEDPENLYRYIASQLSALVIAADEQKMAEIAKELLMLREANRALQEEIIELRHRVETYEEWLRAANLLIANMFGRLNVKDKIEVLNWYIAYTRVKRGEVVATNQAEGEEGA